MADEPFLESALDDKRKPVRSAAADLLARLPDSGLCQRMKERAVALLQFQAGSGGILKKRKPTIEVTLPDGCDKDMARDGIDARSRPKMGQKAYVLCQILAGTPLIIWTNTWAAKPDVLIGAAGRSDFQDLLIQGWAIAAVRQRNAQWALELLKCGYFLQQEDKAIVGDRAELLKGLLGCLDAAASELLLTEMLKSKPFPLHTHPAGALLGALPGPWSAPLSRLVLAALREHYARHSDGYDYELRRVVGREWAARLDPAMAEEASQGWPTRAATWTQGNDDMIGTLVATLRFRRAYLEDLKK
jgi:hypothetical protein